MKLFDQIVVTKNIPSKGLKEGDIGTVVMIHGDYEGFEIEFFTLMGKTRSVETLSKGDVRSIGPNEVASSRKIA